MDGLTELPMKTNKRWVLVKVERGIPTSIDFFKDEQKAIRADSDWRAKMNPDYDETRIFQTNLQDIDEKEFFSVESEN
jgi:hypothetical protein